jgi:hypothetical protein
MMKLLSRKYVNLRAPAFCVVFVRVVCVGVVLLDLFSAWKCCFSVENLIKIGGMRVGEL